MNIINTIKNKVVWGEKTSLVGSIFAGIVAGICLLGIVMPQATNADFANTTNASYVVKASNEDKKIVKTVKVIATAYSSSWDETTGIPGVPGIVTASGKSVAPEIIANNGLPFGTEVRFPKLFRDKVFIVGDRLNERYGPDRVDFFMQSKQLAINFGVKNAEMEILED